MLAIGEQLSSCWAQPVALGDETVEAFACGRLSPAARATNSRPSSPSNGISRAGYCRRSSSLLLFASSIGASRQPVDTAHPQQNHHLAASWIRAWRSCIAQLPSPVWPAEKARNWNTFAFSEKHLQPELQQQLAEF